jgi:hypothetical protein
MSEIAARTFLLGFMLLYAVLILGFVCWNLRNWFSTSGKRWFSPNALERLRHLLFRHHPRNAH